jgi:serine/threonine protein phosphatase PrpC
MTLYLRIGALSHVGIVRDGNEDSLFAGHQLLVVADGVGGSAYGEVASATTISTFAPIDGEPPDSVDDPLAVLREGVKAANDRVRELTERDPKLMGMGTTLTAMLWSQQRLGLAQVGDSRAYRLRDGQLDQVSRDQTFVQMLVEEGRITPEQALSHPQRSVILSAIDGREPLEPALELLDAQVGDRYLLCSDGLSDYVAVADIAAGMTSEDPQPTCERLVALALEAGAPDNVSCIVADLVDSEPASDDRLPIIAGAADEIAEAADDDHHPTTELRTASAAGASTPAAAPRQRRPDSAERPGASHAQRRGAGRRLGIVAAVVVVLVAVAVVGTVVYSRHQYYVAATGAPPTQQVAIYQGVHGHAPGLGSHVKATTNIPVTALPEDERQQVQGSGINASGASGAQQVVNNLRQDSCALATAAATPASTASVAPTPGPTGGTSALSPKPSTSPTAPPWCAP